MACQSWRWQPFRTTPPYSAEEKSAGSVECNHTPTEASPPSPLASVLRNTCAPQAMVSVLQERMSEAPAPSLAQRVCIASLLWCRCSGRVSEASAPMSGPGEACPNIKIALNSFKRLQHLQLPLNLKRAGIRGRGSIYLDIRRRLRKGC